MYIFKITHLNYLGKYANIVISVFRKENAGKKWDYQLQTVSTYYWIQSQHLNKKFLGAWIFEQILVDCKEKTGGICRYSEDF